MNTSYIDTNIGQFVTERPARARLFERLGIDYCCGGNRTLRDACAARALDPLAVLRELEACEPGDTIEDGMDWSRATLTELADHIEAAHHAYLREALPRLTGLIEKVVRTHSQQHPELLSLRQLFRFFRNELEAHMVKEEHILFPMCRTLEVAGARPAFHCGTINNPIRVMVAEHDHAGDGLATMRALTNGFTPPEDACNTYRALLDGLAELEADMHRHVHEENNILFPRASAAEAALATHR